MSDTHPVVLITGSARRIGAAIARQFHACGWSVVLHANTSSAELQQAAFDFDNVRPGSVLALQADLRDADALPDLVEQAVTHFGRLDALVNNASNFYATPLGQVTAEAMDELYAVNARAPLLLSQAAAPYQRRQQGCIVNLTYRSCRPLAGNLHQSRSTTSNASPNCACARHSVARSSPLTGSMKSGAISASGFSTKACFSSGRGMRRWPGPSTTRSP